MTTSFEFLKITFANGMGSPNSSTTLPPTLVWATPKTENKRNRKNIFCKRISLNSKKEKTPSIT